MILLGFLTHKNDKQLGSFDMLKKIFSIYLTLLAHFTFASETNNEASSAPAAPVEASAQAFHTNLSGQFIYVRALERPEMNDYQDGEDRYGRVYGNDIFKLHFSIQDGATDELLEELKALMLRFPEVSTSAKIYDPSWRNLIQTQISLAEAWGFMDDPANTHYTVEGVEALIASLYEQAEEILEKQEYPLSEQDERSLKRILDTKEERRELKELIEDLSLIYLPSSKRLAGGYAEGTLYLNEFVKPEELLVFSAELEEILGSSSVPVSLGRSTLPIPGLTRVSMRKAYLQSGNWHEKVFTYCSVSTSSRETLKLLEGQLRTSPLYRGICQIIFDRTLLEKINLLKQAEEALEMTEQDPKTFAVLLQKVTTIESSLEFFLKTGFEPIQKKKKKKKGKAKQDFSTVIKKHLSELNTAKLMISAQIEK